MIILSSKAPLKVAALSHPNKGKWESVLVARSQSYAGYQANVSHWGVRGAHKGEGGSWQEPVGHNTGKHRKSHITYSSVLGMHIISYVAC